MSKKPISEAERRQQLIEQAAEVEARKRAKAKQVYDGIWSQFSTDRRKGRSVAYSNLLTNLTTFASDLVPAYMTAKEHLAMIAEAEGFTKGDQQTANDDPKEIMSKWLRGELELSRIALESV